MRIGQRQYCVQVHYRIGASPVGEQAVVVGNERGLACRREIGPRQFGRDNEFPALAMCGGDIGGKRLVGGGRVAALCDIVVAGVEHDQVEASTKCEVRSDAGGNQA
jgi:hypothetical protein